MPLDSEPRYGLGAPAPVLLTPRWYPLRNHAMQQAYWASPARFNVVPAGRRSGKTETAKRRVVRASLRGNRWGNARFFAAAPTWQQAKNIYWRDLKAMVPARFLAGTPSESELTIRLVNGTDLCVFGMDRPERIEGQPWDGGVLDEYANMRAHAWEAHVRPALSDRQGWCDLIGVPEGRNHYYDRYQRARADESGEWKAFTWKSSEVLPLHEIEAAKRDMDELTYTQEYEASFVTFEGRAYYPFEEGSHCRPLAYDPTDDLVFCFDFNAAPGVAAVCQEQKLPNGLFGTGVIGQVHIPRNSNTVRVGTKLLQDWQKHRSRVKCYGDATGGAGGSAKVQGSDWDLLRKVLRDGVDGIPGFGNRVSFHVPLANPRERVRVNAVNSRLRSMDGSVRLMVDPKRAPAVVKDFEGVRLITGGAGEIDKKTDKTISHISDAVGYYIVKQFPVAPVEYGTLEIEGV